MRFQILTVFVLLLLLLSASIVSVNSISIKSFRATETGSRNILFVDDDGGADFTSIQDAINASSDGDTVFVYSGTYYENIKIEDKLNLTLTGENKNSTLIDGSGSGNVIYIHSSSVFFSNFTICNSGPKLLLDVHNGCYCDAGIYVSFGQNCIIKNNKFINNKGVGVLINSYQNRFFEVVNNEFISNNLGFYCIKGNVNISYNIFKENKIGIKEFYSSLNIQNNNFSNNNIGVQCYSDIINNNTFYKDGLGGGKQKSVKNNSVNGKPLVYLYNETNISVDNAGQIIIVKCNNITVQSLNISNTSLGIDIINSQNCKISNNIINNNYIGGLNIGSKNNNISYNKINYNKGYGLKTWDDNYIYKNEIIGNNNHGIIVNDDSNVISHNNISSNGNFGIQLNICNFNKIIYNHISKNKVGIKLEYDFSWDKIGCYENQIINNNFISNSISAIPTTKGNEWDQNYWNRNRILPKILFWITSGGSKKIVLEIDWNPASEPYDIC